TCQLASDHLECRRDLPDGCPRCNVRSPTVCCELCSPQHFTDFARVDIAKPKQQPSHSRIADYQADRLDLALRDDLHKLRKQRTGGTRFRNLGAGSFMSAEVLQRIVDCAHFHKIHSTADLFKETRWHRTGEDGDEVLAFILKHKPPPTPLPPVFTAATATPLCQINQNVSAPGTPSTPQVRQCSKCKLYGHICLLSSLFSSCALWLILIITALNKRCPKYQAHTPAPRARRADTENNPPSPAVVFAFAPGSMALPAPNNTPRIDHRLLYSSTVLDTPRIPRPIPASTLPIVLERSLPSSYINPHHFYSL
ncbi:hypothetical protein B0H10DRAFT_2343892, partial [Mycena sp. CBHHK59/15]